MKNNKVKKIEVPVHFDDSNIGGLVVPYDWVKDMKRKKFFWFNDKKYELENIIYTKRNKDLPTMCFKRVFEKGETDE